MGNQPAELLEHLCSRLQITACLIIGSADFYNQACRVIPKPIRPHFIYFQNSESPVAQQDDNRFSYLQARLQECLLLEDTLRTLLIIDADTYLSSCVSKDDGCRFRNAFQDLPFCVSIGFSADRDYRGRLSTILSNPAATVLQGYCDFSRDDDKRTTVWIELHGSHLNPNHETFIPLRVAAIIIAHNESDILEDCLTHLHAQGIKTHLIDDESDDATAEIASTLLKEGILTGYQRSGLPEDCEERWTELLTLSREKAQTLDVDWIIHHDADELRESPWEGIGLSQAISIIDGLGYNCIDHTVIEFLFHQEFSTAAGHRTSLSPVERLNRFRFPAHRANFTQLKAWRKADWEGMTDGGHRVMLKNQSIFPLKFLIKHYPLRSLEQAKRKVLAERISRFSAERKTLGWHVHYDSFQYFQEVMPWTRRELHPFIPQTFYSEFLIERLTGCGLDQIDHTELNTLTARKVIDAQEQFRAHIAQAMGIDLLAAAVVSHEHAAETTWNSQSAVLQHAIHALVKSHTQTLDENSRLSTALAESNQACARSDSALVKTRALLQKTKLRLDRTTQKLIWNRNSLQQAQEAHQHLIRNVQSAESLLKSMAVLISRLAIAPPAAVPTGRSHARLRHGSDKN